MPSITDGRKQIVTSLPSIEGSSITLWDNLTMGDAAAIRDIDEESAQGIKTIHALIKEWNLDEPLTVENVGKMTPDDFSFLLEQTELGKKAKMAQEEKEDAAFEKKTR